MADNLLFLADNDSQLLDHRKSRHNQNERPEWFEDQRHLASQQAQYLNRLTDLKSQLDKQDRDQDHSLQRYQPHQGLPPKGALKARQDRSVGSSAGESIQHRHRRLLQEKQERLGRQPGVGSPRIDYLAGKSAIDADVKSTRSSLDGDARSNTVSRKTRLITDQKEIDYLIELQRARIQCLERSESAFMNKSPRATCETSVSAGGSPMYASNTGSLMCDNNTPPLKQVTINDSLHLKDDRGLYKRARRPGGKPGSNMTNLNHLIITPDTYKLDINGGEFDGRADPYAVPASTPVTSRPSSGGDARTLPYSTPVTSRLIPLAQSYRLQHMRRKGLVYQHHAQNESLRPLGNPKVTTFTKNKAQPIRGTPRKTNQGHCHGNGQPCLFCQHPELLPKAIPLLPDVIAGERRNIYNTPDEDRRRMYSTPEGYQAHWEWDEEHEDGDIISEPESEKPRTPRRKLVIEMPNIVFRPPSPPSLSVTARTELETAVNLRKALRQSQLRQKELKNLLDDVLELNELTEEMKQKEGAVQENED